MAAPSLVKSKDADVVYHVLSALRVRQPAWLRSAGGIKPLATAWASIRTGRSQEPPPDPDSTDLGTPEQLAAVVDAVTHGPEPVAAQPTKSAEKVDSAI